ncbi:MAG: cob(I)yrinic acid a,c-diamide adenosyltransferase [Alphaproteobacteria bacterium]|nr:MAG: cob(I)yrinic acid a,c-diamide adenosyltransferase [Alphaproteobacteria bacterium]
MKKAAVYTRSGDKGTTGLVGGTRIKKSDPRIHLYGEVDELNSFIGLGISFLDKSFDKTFLYEIQSSLFDLGSNLACEKEKRAQFKLPQIKDAVIEKLETEIDKMDSKLKPLHTFILPSGSQAASSFHVCRTVCRRVERQLVDFEDVQAGEVPGSALAFINRLSDYFFILARYLNHSKQIEEINWIPKTE